MCAVALLWSGVSSAEPDDAPSGDCFAKNELVRMGYLPVTLLGARPDDKEDDTAALQRAIDTARSCELVAYFPSGTYLVSDTLYAVQKVSGTKRGRYRQDRQKANVLVGAHGARAVLKLHKGEGFDDPSRPKPLVWIWAQPRDTTRRGSRDPHDEQPNISFNQIFRGIDIDLRDDANGGAVGIRHAGSQGSMLEDVSIHAEGAYAGVYNLPGQGGGTYKLSVHGGRYGIVADASSRFPVAAGVSLLGQTELPLRWDGQSNFTLAGFRIERSTPGPALRMASKGAAFRGAMTLVDGTIAVREGIAVDNRGAKNLYLRDVYVSGAQTLVRSAGRDPVRAAKGSASRIAEYSYTGAGAQAIIDDAIQGEGTEQIAVERASGPAADMPQRHLWDEEQMPAFDAAGVVNVRDFGAKGDGVSDDSAALRRALREHDQVFLPKGVYLINEPVMLDERDRLFGASKTLSVIRAGARWRKGATSAVISTADAADAKTALSSLRIEFDAASPPLTALEWRAGRASLMHDVMVGVSQARTQRRLPTFVVRGQGGGRWYAVAAEWTRLRASGTDEGYRHLLIEGTREPLHMYGVNVERAPVHPQAEIRNAQHVSIYYLKGESKPPHAGILRIRDSRDVNVFGYSGNAAPEGRALISVETSSQVRLVNIAPLHPGAQFDTAMQARNDKILRVNGRHSLSVLME